MKFVRHAVVCLAFVLLPACGGSSTGSDPDFSHPEVSYVHLFRDDPRPLQIHVLQLDLQDPRLSLALDIAPDPDGAGVAETVLAAPVTHAERGGFLAGVNANAWRMVPPPGSDDAPGYVVDGPCDISGWAVADGLQRSPVQGGYWSFWVDESGAAGIANLAALPAFPVRWAVAGFGGLLLDGVVLPGPSETRHPRTALGLLPDGHTLVLAVVDGRQPGYSEGMSTHELAQLMLELGCEDALNLDGGGSSAMVLRDTEGALWIVNRPSEWTGPRPIPMLFGVRRTS